jgi:hypothetical protein
MTVVTLRQARLIEDRIGHRLTLIDVTQYGDAEAMVLITTPVCEYCGRLNPTGRCASCGASVLKADP